MLEGLAPSFTAASFAGPPQLLASICRIRSTDNYTLRQEFDKLYAASFLFELFLSLAKLIMSDKHIANVDIH